MPLYVYTCGDCGHKYKTIMAVDGPDPGCNKCGVRTNQKREISKPQSPKMEGYKEWGYNKYTQEYFFGGDGTRRETEYNHREVEAKTKEIKKKIEGQGATVAVKKK